MVDRAVAYLGRRVVALSPKSAGLSAAQSGQAGLEFAYAVHPYQAASELLGGRAIALVVDLRMLPGRHRRLLDIARSVGAEILVVGPLPSGLSAEDLGGVRLVATADLPRILSEITGVGSQPEARLADSPPVVTPRSDLPIPKAKEPSPPSTGNAADNDLSAVARQELQDAVAFADNAAKGHLAEPDTSVDVMRDRTAGVGSAPPPRSDTMIERPVALLTEEELTALLEKES